MPISPILIDGTVWPEAVGNIGGTISVLRDSTLFTFLHDFNFTTIYAYSSTDGGLTWSQIDAANRPTDAGTMSCVLDGDLVHVLYVADLGGSFEIRIIDFDLSANGGTGEWVSASLVTGGPTPPSNTLMASVIDGTTYTVLYTLESPQRTCYAQYNGAAWINVDTQVSTFSGNSGVPQGIVVDGSLIHFFYSDNTFTYQKLYHRAMSGGVLDTEQLIWTETPYTGGGILTGRAIIWNGSVILPFRDQVGPLTSDEPPSVVYATSGISAPSWTVKNISSLPNQSITTAPWLFTLASSSNLYALWIDDIAVKVYYSVAADITTWTDRTVFYDVNSDPPTPPPLFGYIPTTLGVVSDDGVSSEFGFSTVINIANGDVPFNVTAYWLGPIGTNSETFNATLNFFSADLVIGFNPPIPPPLYCIPVPPNSITPDLELQIEPLEQT